MLCVLDEDNKVLNKTITDKALVKTKINKNLTILVNKTDENN